MRHGALRTAFFTDNNQQLKQHILTTTKLHLEHRQMIEDDIAVEYRKMKGYVFDLERGELMKTKLLSIYLLVIILSLAIFTSTWMALVLRLYWLIIREPKIGKHLVIKFSNMKSIQRGSSKSTRQKNSVVR